MNKLGVLLLLVLVSVTGCKRKTIHRPVKVPPKPFSTPVDSVERYIDALNNNDYETLNNCNHPKSRLKEDSGEFERLKDELKFIKITNYKIIQSAISANGDRAQVRVDWTLVYHDPKTQKDMTFSDSGRVIELEKYRDLWLVSPHNNGSMFLTKPTVSTEKVDEKDNPDDKKD